MTSIAKDPSLEYYEWLCNRVATRGKTAENYGLLLNFLFYLPFYWIEEIPMDENRAKDGISLRQAYLFDHPFDTWPQTDYMDDKASVLEVMIAMAGRCESDYLGDPLLPDGTYKWFWAMIDNLDLADQTNDNFNEGLCHYILSACLNRDYGPDGIGSFWPSSNTHSDLSREEIWSQMGAWIIENFPEYM